VEDSDGFLGTSKEDSQVVKSFWAQILPVNRGLLD
jgi:hypothetical protein